MKRCSGQDDMMKACIGVLQGNISNRMCTYRDGERFIFKHLTHVIVETWQVQFLMRKLAGWLKIQERVAVGIQRQSTGRIPSCLMEAIFALVRPSTEQMRPPHCDVYSAFTQSPRFHFVSNIHVFLTLLVYAKLCMHEIMYIDIGICIYVYVHLYVCVQIQMTQMIQIQKQVRYRYKHRHTYTYLLYILVLFVYKYQDL